MRWDEKLFCGFNLLFLFLSIFPADPSLSFRFFDSFKIFLFGDTSLPPFLQKKGFSDTPTKQDRRAVWFLFSKKITFYPRNTEHANGWIVTFAKKNTMISSQPRTEFVTPFLIAQIVLFSKVWGHLKTFHFQQKKVLWFRVGSFCSSKNYLSAPRYHFSREMNQVIISGGGIAGLSLANALRRVGVGFTVIEKAPVFGDVGFGLTMGFNSLHALRKIDPLLEQEVVRVSVHGTDFAMREKNLQWIAKPGNFHWQENWCTERDELRYGPTRFLPISRYNLHASLLQGLQFNPSSPNCDGGKLLSGRENIQLGKKPQQESKWLFQTGLRLKGDVLVGAEGGQSPIRSELHKRFGSTTLGPAPPKPYTGMSLWGGTTNQMGPLLRSNKEENLFMWNFLDDGSLFLVLPMKPGGDLAYWSLGLNRDTPGDPSFAKSTYVLRNWLLKEGSRFSDDLHVADYINSTDFSLSPSSEGGFYRWDLFDLGDRTVPHWGSGRVTLIGDAAHQVTPWVGQGAGISIEDAHCFGVLCCTTPLPQQIWWQFGWNASILWNSSKQKSHFHSRWSKEKQNNLVGELADDSICKKVFNGISCSNSFYSQSASSKNARLRWPSRQPLWPFCSSTCPIEKIFCEKFRNFLESLFFCFFEFLKKLLLKQKEKIPIETPKQQKVLQKKIPKDSPATKIFVEKIESRTLENCVKFHI